MFTCDVASIDLTPLPLLLLSNDVATNAPLLADTNAPEKSLLGIPEWLHKSMTISAAHLNVVSIFANWSRHVPALLMLDSLLCLNGLSLIRQIWHYLRPVAMVAVSCRCIQISIFCCSLLHEIDS